MKFIKKLKKIKKMHVLLATLALACIFSLGSYIYVHKYIKDAFIEKLASRGIHAEVDSVSLKGRVFLNDVSLKIKDSEISIRKISSNYWLTNIVVTGADVKGNVQDYLDLKSKQKISEDSSGAKGGSMSVSFIDCNADLKFKRYSITAESVGFSTDDYVVRANKASVGRMIMKNISFSLKTNEGTIEHIYEKLDIVDKKNGGWDYKKKPSVADFSMPTLPNEKYKLHIKRVGRYDSNIDIKADKVDVIIESGKNLSASVTGKNFHYFDGTYTSGSFEIKLYGTEKRISFSIDANEPQFWNSRVKTDVYMLPLPVSLPNIHISADIIGVNSLDDLRGLPTLSVKNGHISVGEVLLNFSFSLIKGTPLNYNVSMARTECSKVMEVNPFKSVFHKRCSSLLVDTGKCRGDDDPTEDTKYSGMIEWDVIGSTILKPKVKFYSTCNFEDVPWYMKKERFQKPFTLRVGEPISRKVGDWKPRKQVKLGPGTNSWVPLNLISYYVERALLVTEDGRFHSHNGIDPMAIANLLTETISSREIVRGGSTITMQLAKNLWLMRDRTIDRKVQELFLTLYLESIMSKSQIMELYLNVIEFGPDVYGIYNGAKYYFKKVPLDLTLKESLFLASILPKPSVSYFNGDKLNEGTNGKLNTLLSEMFDRELITEVEMNQAKSEVLYKK